MLRRKYHSKPLLEDGFNLLHRVVLHNLTISCSLEAKVMELQKTDVGIFHIKRKMEEEETKHFRLDERGVLWFKDRLVVPKDRELRNQILDEAHSSKLSIQQDVPRFEDPVLVDKDEERDCCICG